MHVNNVMQCNWRNLVCAKSHRWTQWFKWARSSSITKRSSRGHLLFKTVETASMQIIPVQYAEVYVVQCASGWERCTDRSRKTLNNWCGGQNGQNWSAVIFTYQKPRRFQYMSRHDRRLRPWLDFAEMLQIVHESTPEVLVTTPGISSTRRAVANTCLLSCRIYQGLMATTRRLTVSPVKLQDIHCLQIISYVCVALKGFNYQSLKPSRDVKNVTYDRATWSSSETVVSVNQDHPQTCIRKTNRSIELQPLGSSDVANAQELWQPSLDHQINAKQQSNNGLGWKNHACTEHTWGEAWTGRMIATAWMLLSSNIAVRPSSPWYMAAPSLRVENKRVMHRVDVHATVFFTLLWSDNSHYKTRWKIA